MKTIDLNCDMGESFGAWHMGDDEAVLPHVSSINVACGLHAGDWNVMHRTVRAAFARGVAVGAHPSLPDLQGFGRRTINLAPAEAYELVLYQVGALSAFCRASSSTWVMTYCAKYNTRSRLRRLTSNKRPK